MARTEDVMGETIYQDKVESKRKEKLSQVVNVYKLLKVVHPVSFILGFAYGTFSVLRRRTKSTQL